MNNKAMRLIASFCSICILLSSSSIHLLSTKLYVGSSDVLKYEVDEVFVGTLKHNILITNPTFNSVVGNLLVPLIRNETARHYAILYNVSSSKGKPVILNDDSGNLYASWNNIAIHGKETLTVELNYYILSLGTQYVIDSSLIEEYNKTSEFYKKFTQPEKLIESTNTDIISTAKNIVSNTTNPYEKVSKIYSFVVTHLRYVAQEEEKGAYWALKNGIGDCSEYSYLFVALCRAAGIPAKIQAGFAFHTINEILSDGHMWAEYYIENYGWIPLDATWRLFSTIDCTHFSSIQSLPKLTSYVNYVFNSTEPGVVNDEQSLKLQKCSSNVFDDASSFVENTYTTVQKINQVKFTIFLVKALGATLIFTSEALDIEQNLLDSQINLQKAIDSWNTAPQVAEANASEALKYAEHASQGAWMLIAKMFILLISIFAITIVCMLFFIKRRSRHLTSSSSILKKQIA